MRTSINSESMQSDTKMLSKLAKTLSLTVSHALIIISLLPYCTLNIVVGLTINLIAILHIISIVIDRAINFITILAPVLSI